MVYDRIAGLHCYIWSSWDHGGIWGVFGVGNHNSNEWVKCILLQKGACTITHGIESKNINRFLYSRKRRNCGTHYGNEDLRTFTITYGLIFEMEQDLSILASVHILDSHHMLHSNHTTIRSYALLLGPPRIPKGEQSIQCHQTQRSREWFLASQCPRNG